MSDKHCPLCNTNEISANGAVVYSQSVLVEHSCGHCGHLFYLSDRRNLSKDEGELEQYLAKASRYASR